MQRMQTYRRCHVCGDLCQSNSQIRKCSSCGKPFAPFYYFNDQFTPVLYEGGLRAPEIQGQWRPLQGLTAYWQTE